MPSRTVRLVIDAVFLLLALTFLIQDWGHHDWPGAVLWGVLTAFWVAMIPYDMRRTDDRVM
jgi:hypothetical protein